MKEREHSQSGCLALFFPENRFRISNSFFGRDESKAGLTLKDCAVYEINEAFASVVLGICRILDSSSLMERKFGQYGWTKCLGEIPPDDLNPHGGAIALGHPVGVSGLRLAMTSLLELKRRNAERALISACVGGGQGVAMILERK